MSGSIDFQILLWRMLGSAPWMLVVFAGVVWCMLNASRMPRTSLLVGIALGIQLLGFFVLPLLTARMFAMWPADATDELGMRIIVNGLIHAVPSGTALALLLFAAFRPERGAAESASVRVGERRA